MPYERRREIKFEIKKLCVLGIIRESKSNFRSPVFIVSKASGIHISIVDYGRTNYLSLSDNFPIPTYMESFISIRTKQNFSKIGLVSGYHHIKVDDSSIPYINFAVQCDQY